MLTISLMTKPTFSPFVNFFETWPCLKANRQQIVQRPRINPMNKPSINSKILPSRTSTPDPFLADGTVNKLGIIFLGRSSSAALFS